MSGLSLSDILTWLEDETQFTSPTLTWADSWNPDAAPVVFVLADAE